MVERFDVVHRYGSTYRRRARSTAVERGEHGTVAGYQGGCRCSGCGRARNRYDRTWKAARKVLAGREVVWMVPTARVRAHVVRLRDAGWSVRQIGEASGWSEQTVRRLQRSDRCWNLVADAVLALEP